MSLNGTDISGYQPGSPNLTGDAFSIVKATEGVGFQNPNWAAQVDACRADGAMVGHYHFANGLNTPAAEAQYFWGVVKTKWVTGEPLALDIEGSFFTNAANPVQWALEFAQELFALSGLKVLIYIDWQHEKAASYNWQPLVDYNCGLWGAAYNNTGFGDPSPWPFLVLWQNADTNVSGGDSDVLYGDAATFHAYGTPTGGIMPVLDSTDIQNIRDAVRDVVFNTTFARQGIAATNQGGTTNLGAIEAWFDSAIQTLDAHMNRIDSEVKAVALAPTDAQVAALADRLKSALPPAVLATFVAQLQKA